MNICEENYNNVLQQATWFRGFLDALIESEKISISQTQIMRTQMDKLLFYLENIDICGIGDIDNNKLPRGEDLNNISDEIPF